MATSVDAKLLKATKFPTEFSQKVDMQKVNLEVMKKYVIPSPSLLYLTLILTLAIADGLQARFQKSLGVRTTSL